MADLTTFKNELTLIVNNLAKAVVTEIFTAAEKVSLNKQNPETEEKLSCLVDSLCVEAVDKILKMVETPGDLKDPPGDLKNPPGDLKDPPGDLKDPPGDLKDPPRGLKDPPRGLNDPKGYLNDPPRDQKDPPRDLNDPPGDLKDPPRDLKDPQVDLKDPQIDLKDPQGDSNDPPGDLKVPLKDPLESDGSIECLMKRTEGGGKRPPTGHGYVLVYGSAAVHSNSLLVSLQSQADAKANGENKAAFTSPPPPQADVPDHEYARPPPANASSVEGGVSAALSRKRRSRKRRSSKRRRISPNTSQNETTESHQQCSQCGMLLPNIERLSDHQRKSHPVCSLCGTVFSGILRLREHTIKEHGLLPYTCDYCPKRFNHKAHRNLHVKARHTGEKSCHCDICGKGYSCVSVLKTHRMTHFDKTFICDVCGKSFYHACHLTRHKMVHREVRPYQCSTCGKGFTQAANLRSHQAIHTGERPLCSICGKSYRCLKNHVISKHSHELPSDELAASDAIITCEVCGKKFPNPSQLKVHQRSHTGEKPFPCDICGKSYSMKQQLKDHRYTHTGEKPYSCTLCSKTFNLATSFMRHRSIHTGETPYSCLDCGKHFRLLTFLKAHLQTKAHLKQTQQRHADDL